MLLFELCRLQVDIAKIVTMAVGLEGRIFYMKLPAPVTVYFKGGVGIKFKINLVLAPIRIAIYVEVCVVCGVKPWKLAYCCAGRELWSIAFPKQDWIKTLVEFELPPPDWSPPVRGTINVAVQFHQLEKPRPDRVSAPTHLKSNNTKQVILFGRLCDFCIPPTTEARMGP